MIHDLFHEPIHWLAGGHPSYEVFVMDYVAYQPPHIDQPNEYVFVVVDDVLPWSMFVLALPKQHFLSLFP